MAIRRYSKKSKEMGKGMTKKTFKYNNELENIRKKIEESTTQPMNLFYEQDVIALGKFWIQKHEDDDAEYTWEYNMGVIAGVEYMLYLLERCGD